MSKYNGDYYPQGFGHQEDTYSCGAYAFAHAMNLIGIPMVINESKKICKTVSYWKSFEKNITLKKLLRDPIKAVGGFLYDPGTEASGIIKACKKLGLTVREMETESKIETKEFLRNSLLERGYPVIMHVNFGGDEGDLGHWITCGGIVDGGKFVTIDSAPFDEDDIITLYSWRELVDRLTWDDEFQFYGIAVGNKNVSAVGRFRELSEGLRRGWGYYLADLVEIFDMENRNHKNDRNYISIKDFFKTYSDEIIDNTSFWLLEAKRKKVEKVLKNYRAIAEAYDIKIPKSEVGEALISFVTAFNATITYESGD